MTHFKLTATVFFLYLCFPVFGQEYSGNWEYVNKENEKVTIELKKSGEYNVKIPGRNFRKVIRKNERSIPTELHYEIDESVTPPGIDIITNDPDIRLKGIIEMLDENTLQIQMNRIPNGLRPATFNPDSPNYIKCKKVSPVVI